MTDDREEMNVSAALTGASTSATMASYAAPPNLTEYSRIAPRTSALDERSFQEPAKRPQSADTDATAKKKAKRRKVNHACLYCRRSHMTCDDGRPCQRCIKREIGHLCHDEPRQSSKSAEKSTAASTSSPTSTTATTNNAETKSSNAPTNYYAPMSPNLAWPMSGSYFPYQPETLGNEFSVLTDFLESLDERSFFNPPPTTVAPPLISSSTSFAGPSLGGEPFILKTEDSTEQQQQQSAPPPPQQQPMNIDSLKRLPSEEPPPPVLPAATKTEQFLLTAADQEPGSRDERLRRVIRSKYEAGLLKPYNYVKGYARLSRWMDTNVTQESKQAILQPLSVVRPKFRAIAQSLTDIDLVLIEEAFERLLLDYDRVFSVMGVPACLWRRTGEIYKGNREFAELVGVDGHMLREGRMCIYELMAEESAVNYWEKYGHVAFDSNQKAVLTTCVLRFKPTVTPSSSSSTSTSSLLPTSSPSWRKGRQQESKEEGFINCCFSFTIRRDAWGIPSMIVGNFIKC